MYKNGCYTYFLQAYSFTLAVFEPDMFTAPTAPSDMPVQKNGATLSHHICT